MKTPDNFPMRRPRSFIQKIMLRFGYVFYPNLPIGPNVWLDDTEPTAFSKKMRRTVVQERKSLLRSDLCKLGVKL